MTAKDLKNALLQEAVQGRLVPQIASEGNARDLLEEIRKEKLSHGLDFANAKSGKRKSKKETALADSNPCDITEEEIPFDIPDNWCWCRLGEIGDWKAGSTPSRSNPELYNGNIPWLKTGDLTDGNINEIPECISKKALESCSMRLNPIGSVLIAMYGATIGKLGILKIEATTNQACCACVPYNGIYNKYLFYYLMSQKKDFTEKAEGGAQPNISREKLVVHLLPLPPYEEQKRIVAAIEKFMPLIEEYGKKETQLKAINEKIGTLTKKAILQEAVQGKLVPQIASEGNARDLLEEIRKEKLSHGLDFANAKSGKRKSKKETAVAGSNPCDITEEEIPFDIPESWCWCRWGDLSESIQYGYNAPAKETGRIKMVRISDIHENKVFWDSVPYCDISEDEIQTYILKKNDILSELSPYTL